MRNTLLEMARKYRYQLRWSVIPIKPNSKVPLVDWKKYQDTLMSMGEIEQHFSNHEANIALITGAISGIIVVDSDDYKEKGGTVALNSPLIATTPRGGKHYYFKYETPTHNSVNEELAVDVRANGGYVLLPPSIVDGNRYQFNQPPTPNLISSLPAIPKEYLMRIQQPQSLTQKVKIETIVGIKEGSRDISLLKAANSHLNTIPESEWESKGLLVIRGINNTFIPPLNDRDVERIFKQACNFIRNNPLTKKSTDTSRAEPINWKTQLAKVNERRKLGETKGYSSGYNSLDKLTNGYIPGQTYLFFGGTNTGKSTFLLNSLMRMARQNRSVMYFDLENNALLTTERMVLINEENLTKDAWDSISDLQTGAELTSKLENLPFHLWDTESLIQQFGAITYEAIEQCIKNGFELGIKIFAVDHLHYFEPSTSDYGQLQDIARRLNDLSSKLNIVILMVAHTRKGLLTQKDGFVKTYRPTIEDIAGSAMISRHTKNIIGIMRNPHTEDLTEQSEAYLFADKTKTGKVGTVKLQFNPRTLHFREESEQ